ncbi:endopeptidase catalytic subunit IMP1 [Sporobolomyces salmoneus]|uniref:endopeptidase catalytic subunit IMP1 n=1 Tax=Sporobolomyces salmoneus TaxID=183962 RepID=UPI00316F1D10
MSIALNQGVKKTGRYVLNIMKVLCCVHLFNEHVAEIRPCTGASMYPTLPHSGTFVLHSSLSLRLSPLARGNLVTSISPLSPSHQVLKRVIGLPGDTVLVDPTGERGKVEEWCKVPEGHVWLAGDNTSNSTDSRDYGPVPIALIRGRVVAKIWPEPGWLRNSFHKV